MMLIIIIMSVDLSESIDLFLYYRCFYLMLIYNCLQPFSKVILKKKQLAKVFKCFLIEFLKSKKSYSFIFISELKICKIILS